MNVSFSGCGFIGVYHIGAASCLQTYAPFLLTNKLAGASAGAMAAAALVGDVSLTDMAREVLKVACKANEKEPVTCFLLPFFNSSFKIFLLLPVPGMVWYLYNH